MIFPIANRTFGTLAYWLALAIVLSLTGCGDQGAALGPDGVTGPDNSQIPATGGNAGNNLPSNGLTFASGNDAQTQPRVAMNQHIDNGLNPTLRELQAAVFTPKCSYCHSGGGAALPSSMDLSNLDATYVSLINVTGTEFPSIPLVAPGMSTNSYLVRKIEGTQLVGAQMPLQGGMLSNEEIIAIKSWIDQGAQY